MITLSLRPHRLPQRCSELELVQIGLSGSGVIFFVPAWALRCLTEYVPHEIQVAVLVGIGDIVTQLQRPDAESDRWLRLFHQPPRSERRSQNRLPGPGHKTFAVTPLRSARSLGHLQLGHLQKECGFVRSDGRLGGSLSLENVHPQTVALPTSWVFVQPRSSRLLPGLSLAGSTLIIPDSGYTFFPAVSSLSRSFTMGSLALRFGFPGVEFLSRMVALLGTGHP